MKLYLIRHGQTDWNIKGRIQGGTDIPLNATGRQQAGCLAQGMDSRPVTCIFSSHLRRAKETALVIGNRQQVEVCEIEGLEEVGFGRWEGLTREEIKEQYPEEYKSWCLHPVDVAPPGGELQTEIRSRCSRVMEQILAQASGDTAIVSHGATIAYLMEYLMREHPMEEEIIVENASITTIEYIPSPCNFILSEMNDTRHLQ